MWTGLELRERDEILVLGRSAGQQVLLPLLLVVLRLAGTSLVVVLHPRKVVLAFEQAEDS